MIDQQIEIATKDGHSATFITHPERGGTNASPTAARAA